MGFLDTFRKKKNTTKREDELTEDPFKADPLMDTESGLNLPREEQQENPFSNNPYLNQEQRTQSPFQKYQEQNTQQNPLENQQGQNDQKDLQIIIAKLDALRAEVQALNHKIENMGEKQKKRMW